MKKKSKKKNNANKILLQTPSIITYIITCILIPFIIDILFINHSGLDLQPAIDFLIIIIGINFIIITWTIYLTIKTTKKTTKKNN